MLLLIGFNTESLKILSDTNKILKKFSFWTRLYRHSRGHQDLLRLFFPLHIDQYLYNLNQIAGIHLDNYQEHNLIHHQSIQRYICMWMREKRWYK